MTLKLLPVLVSAVLKTSSWDQAITTEGNIHHIFYVPEHLHTDEFINSVEFHNRALLVLSERQYASEDSDSSFNFHGNQEYSQVCFFLAGEDFTTEKTNLINLSKAYYYDEYKDNQDLTQIITEIEIYKVCVPDQDKVEFMKSLSTPESELDLRPIYALEIHEDDEDDDDDY